MKRGKRLLVLTAVLAVFVAGTLILKSVNDAKEAAEKTTEEKPVVLALDTDNLTALAYTYQGETLRFEKTDDVWHYADDTAFPLKTSLITSMVSALKSITASRTVADSLDQAEEYGLKEPAITVTATLNDGTTSTLYLGDKNSVTGETYAYVDGSPTVYMVASTLATKFSYKLYGLITDETFPTIDESTIGKLAYDAGDQSLKLAKYADGNENSYSSLYTWFAQGTDGSETPLDSDNVSTYLENVTGTAIKSTVDYNAASEELGAWGLDTPSAVITVDYTVSHTETVPKATDTPDPNATVSPAPEVTAAPETITGEETSVPEATPSPTPATETITVTEPKELVIYLGGQAEDGSWYMRHSDSTRVFTISADTYEKLMALSLESLIPNQFALISIDTVDSLTVNMNGQTNEYAIARSTVTDEDGKTTANVVYTKDGTEIGETTFKDFYKALIGLERDATTDKAPAGEPYMTITFHRNTTAYPEMTLILYPYDGSFYQAVFNGETGILVNKREIEDLVGTMNVVES